MSYILEGVDVMVKLTSLSVEAMVVISLLGLMALMVAGCSSTSMESESRATPLLGRSKVTVRSEPWTWNRTPHGGSDEKSSQTPSEPSN